MEKKEVHKDAIFFTDLLENHKTWSPSGAVTRASHNHYLSLNPLTPPALVFPSIVPGSTFQSIPIFDKPVLFKYANSYSKDYAPYNFERPIIINDCIFEKELKLYGLKSVFLFSLNVVTKEILNITSCEFKDFTSSLEGCKKIHIENCSSSKFTLKDCNTKSLSIESHISALPSEIEISGSIDEINLNAPLEKILISGTKAKKIRIRSQSTKQLNIKELETDELVINLSNLEENCNLEIISSAIKEIRLEGSLKSACKITLKRISKINKLDFEAFDTTLGKVIFDTLEFESAAISSVFIHSGSNFDNVVLLNCSWQNINHFKINTSIVNKIKLFDSLLPIERKYYLSDNNKEHLYKQLMELFDNNKLANYYSEFKQHYFEELRKNGALSKRGIPLWLNKISSNHATSWPKALGFVLMVNLLFYSAYIFAVKYDICLSKECFQNFPDYVTDWRLNLKYFFEFLSPTGFRSDFYGAFETNVLSNFIFYFGKIVLGYGYYQFIKAFRILS